MRRTRTGGRIERKDAVDLKYVCHSSRSSRHLRVRPELSAVKDCHSVTVVDALHFAFVALPKGPQQQAYTAYEDE